MLAKTSLMVNIALTISSEIAILSLFYLMITDESCSLYNLIPEVKVATFMLYLLSIGVSYLLGKDYLDKEFVKIEGRRR